MGFFNEIYHLYGPTSVRYLKRWATINNKLSSLYNRRIFLLKCRKHELFPDHIAYSLVNMNNLIQHHQGRTGHQIHNLNLRLRKKILNLEISITITEIRKLEKELNFIIENVNSLIPNHITNEFKRRQKISYNNKFHKIKNKNINKLNKLKSDETKKIKVQQKWFKNLTTVEIPENVKTILSLGTKFSISPTIKDFKISNLLADLETIIEDLDDTSKNCYRSQYTNIITNYLHKNHNTKQHIRDMIEICRRFLKAHSELIVTRSDKGNVTVLMYKNDYIQKSQSLLDDRKYYTKLRNDPTSTLQQKANKIVSELKKSRIIDEPTAKTLTIYNSIAPRFYTLPKIHKPTLSVRPIVSSINCPNGHLAKFLTHILTLSYNTNNAFYVSDSFSFSTFINGFQIPPGYILVSFDVVSLFTNLPLELIINSLTTNWDNISPHCNLTLPHFLKILKFIFDSNYLVFNDSYYKQIFGTPMGSCISPILVNYVLDDLVMDCLNKIPFNIPFIKRYVDDLILSVPNDKTQEVLNIFNTYNNNVQFTYEMEENNSIPFLDMRIIRDNNNILRTKWYRKPISSGRYINYHSYHPKRMKINLILALKSN